MPYQDDYQAPLYHRQQHSMVSPESIERMRSPMLHDVEGTPGYLEGWGSYLRTHTGIGGAGMRAMRDPTLALTGNEPLFRGATDWVKAGAATALSLGTLDPSSFSEWDEWIDEWVGEAYGSTVSTFLGYERAEGAYTGPLPGSLDRERSEKFLKRLNQEITVEGRQALLRLEAQEQSDRNIISRTHPGLLFLQGLSSLLVDESFWIDLFVTRKALNTRLLQNMGRGKKVISAALIGSAGAFTSSAIREAVLYKGQLTRTPEDVARAIKIETLLGGVLSTGFATMGMGMRSAVRSRFGQESIPASIDAAESVMMANIKHKPALRNRVSLIIDAMQGGRRFDTKEFDETFDMILDGVNPQVVELTGLRKGTPWGNFVNRFLFLTPNMRLAASELESARDIVEQLADTAMAKSGRNAGVSLERLKTIMNLQANANRLHMRDIWAKSKKAGSNLGSWRNFDIAVEMAYRRQGKIEAGVVIRGTDGRDMKPFVTKDGEELNAEAVRSIKEGEKQFAEEQEVFDQVLVLGGGITRQDIKYRRSLYHTLHKENYVHRIVDRELVGDDKRGFMEGLKAGIEDLAGKQRPILSQELEQLKLDRRQAIAAAERAQAQISGEVTGRAAERAEIRGQIQMWRTALTTLNNDIRSIDRNIARLDRLVAKPVKIGKDPGGLLKKAFNESRHYEYRSSIEVKHQYEGHVVVLKNSAPATADERWIVLHLRDYKPEKIQSLTDAISSGNPANITNRFVYHKTLSAAKEMADSVSGHQGARRFMHRFSIASPERVRATGDSGMTAEEITVQRELLEVQRREVEPLVREAEEEVRLNRERARTEGAEESREFIRESRSELSGADRAASWFDERILEKDAEIRGLEWNKDKGLGVWENYRNSPTGSITPLDPFEARTLLIKDSYIEKFLKTSAEAQRFAFFNGGGLKSLAMQRLGSRSSISFIRTTQDLFDDADKTLTSIKAATREETIMKHGRRAREVHDELIIRSEAQRLKHDARLISDYNQVKLRGVLNDVTRLERDILESRARLREEQSDANYEAYNSLVEEFNGISQNIAKKRIDDTSKPKGHIREHADLHDKMVSVPDSVLSRAMAANQNVAAVEAKWLLDRATKIAEAERKNTSISEVSLQRIQATMDREVELRSTRGENRKKLNRANEKARKDLEILHQRIFGVWSEPAQLWKHAGPLLRQYNYTKSMGMVTLSSLPDIAMGVFTAGLGPYLASSYRFFFYKIRRWATKAPPEDKFFMQDHIYAMEASSTHARVMAMANLDDTAGANAGKRHLNATERMEEIASWGADTTTRLSLLGKWNGYWKAVNSLAASSRIGRIGERLAVGKALTASDRQFLGMLNLDEVDVKDMSVLVDRFGEKANNVLSGHFYHTKAADWKGKVGRLSEERVRELKAKIESAISLNADLSIVTPGVGNVPGAINRTELGRQVTQFRSYFFAATETLVLPMMQRMGQGDPQAFGTLVGLITMGGMVGVAKDALRGVSSFPHITTGGSKADTSSPEDYYKNITLLVANAIDRSGSLGILSEVLNLAEKSKIGPVRMMTGELVGRAKARPITQIFLGPTIGSMEEGWHLLNEAFSFASGEAIDARKVRLGRRFIPFQNVLPFTVIADAGYSYYEAVKAANTSNRIWGTEKEPYEFYWQQFKHVEHRIAPLFTEIDFDNYNPRRSLTE